ncbi:unnamed protein product [Chironomus riparius]|uniref:BTB domain-containing protein n=1 Tax=Chironomus riparius TaxID=315576 RepID=A0A9N9WYI2_9DIPT|nr:unnamed protein product [Chironomus riparius]
MNFITAHQMKYLDNKLKQDFKDSEAKLNNEIQQLKDFVTNLSQQVQEMKGSANEPEGQQIEAKLKLEVERLRNSESKLNQKVEQLKVSESELLQEVKQLRESESKLLQKVKLLQNSESNLLQEVKLSRDSEFKLTKQLQLLSHSELNLTQKVQQFRHSEIKLIHEVNKLKVSESILKIKIDKLKDQEINTKLQLQESIMNESQLRMAVNQLRTDLKTMKLKHAQTMKIKEGLTADFKLYIQDNSTKDFQVQVKDRTFSVHKFLLAARSPTLAELLKANPEANNLNLVDISVDIFEIILKFLYTDELPGDDGTDFLQIFTAAGTLKIRDLKDYAARKIIEVTDTENAMAIYNFGKQYGHDGMQQKAFEQLKRKYPDIILGGHYSSCVEVISGIFELSKFNNVKK